MYKLSVGLLLPLQQQLKVLLLQHCSLDCCDALLLARSLHQMEALEVELLLLLRLPLLLLLLLPLLLLYSVLLLLLL